MDIKMAVAIRNSLTILDFVIYAEKIDEQNSIGFITDKGISIAGHASLMTN